MIDIIYQLGDDALGNFFQIFIPSFTLVSTDPNSNLNGISIDTGNIILRTTTIQIPESGATTYNVNYKTQEFAKIAGKVNSTKTFSMALRIDRYYKEYQKILQWKNAIANPFTGVIGADAFGSAGSSNRVDITVQPIDSDGEVIETSLYWILHNAFIQTVPEISFDYGAGEPISTTLAFQCSTLEEVFPT